jgi:uncharacterized protein YndB with AHSA1/START domain
MGGLTQIGPHSTPESLCLVSVSLGMVCPKYTLSANNAQEGDYLKVEVRKSIEIEASPEEVWALLSKPERILEWSIPLQRFEYTGEQRGSVGSCLCFEHQAPGGTMKLNCVVTEWVENEALAFRMTSGSMLKSYAEGWTVEETPSGSRFTFTEEGELALGIIGSLIQPLAERVSGATVEKMLARLKSLAEEERSTTGDLV